jgi:GGDEF domain-containing protein
MGGDEFFVLLRNLTAEEAIISCIEDMYERISAPFHLHGQADAG